MPKQALRRLIALVCTATLMSSLLVSAANAFDNEPDVTSDICVEESTQADYSAAEDNALSKNEKNDIEQNSEKFGEETEEKSDSNRSETDKASDKKFGSNKDFVTVPMESSTEKTQIEMGVGENYRFVPKHGSTGGYRWTTTNSKVLSVDMQGNVKAEAKGSASVICKTNDGETFVCAVNVGEAPSIVSIGQSYLTLGVGESHKFNGIINAGASAYRKAYCSSSSIGFPITQLTGEASAKKEGRYAAAFFTYNKMQSKCVVLVKKAPTSLSFNSDRINMYEGKTFTLNPTFPTGSYSSTLDISSSDESVASVKLSTDNKLIVTAHKTGTATVTATTYNGKTASCTVNVTKETVNLSISATATSILSGNHAYIKADVSPASAQVSYSSSNTAVATVDQYGVVKGISGGNAVITVTAGKTKKTCNISVSPYSSDTYLMYSYYNLNNGKTLYLKSSGSSFSSSDTSVATVNQKGFVTAKKQGVAIITANYAGSSRTCAVRVLGSDPIRFSYSSPNSASKNERVELIAITDKARTSVKFDIKIGNTVHTVSAVSKTDDCSGKRYIWKGYYTFTSAGEYPVTAYSMYQNNGRYATCNAGKSTVFVTDVTSGHVVSYGRRRPSDEALKLNANFEGYLPQVSDDPLVYDTPTVGHGYVVTNGEEFYNDMSQDEAYAFMVSVVNDSVYSSSVNNFMINHGIKFNQQQFDALVLFVYNLGPGTLYNSDVESALSNCWHNGERNLDYADYSAVKYAVIRRHHAGGACIWGLLYRRIDELEIFFYGEYDRDGWNNKHNMSYPWNCV